MYKARNRDTVAELRDVSMGGMLTSRSHGAGIEVSGLVQPPHPGSGPIRA